MTVGIVGLGYVGLPLAVTFADSSGEGIIVSPGRSLRTIDLPVQA